MGSFRACFFVRLFSITLLLNETLQITSQKRPKSEPRRKFNKTGTSLVGDIRKAQTFEIGSGRYEKLTKKFQNTEKVPFVLGKRFRSLYSMLEGMVNAM